MHLFCVGGVVLNVFPMGMHGQWWSYFLVSVWFMVNHILLYLDLLLGLH